MIRTWQKIIIGIMLICVIVPFIPLVLWSLTDVWPFENPIPDFSMRSWGQTLKNQKILEALLNSIVLCLVVVSISIALSFFAAKNLGTRRFKGRKVLMLLLLVPSFFPQIAIVFGMQKVFSQIGLYNNYAGVVVALLVFYVPYMTLLLSAVFENYDMDLELQARSLGVGRWHILWHVTIPTVRSGLIVSCIFSFIGVWAAYLVVSIVAAPSFKTMSLLAFPMISSASNGYALTSCMTILYILPIALVLMVFSNKLADDGNAPAENPPGGML